MIALKIVLLCLMWVSAADAGYWSCPQRITPNFGKTLQNQPKDWEVFIDKNRYNFNLLGVSFYSGHPKGLAQLRLDSGVWERGENDKGEYWILCSYNDTPINLIRKIPQVIKKCKIEYEKGIFNADRTPAVKDLICN